MTATRGSVRLAGLLAVLGGLGAATGLGCGGEKDTAAAARPDDAFVVRVTRQQQVGLALAKTGLEHAATRALARDMVAMRERTLGILAGPLSRVVDDAATADLGVSPQQGAEDLTPDALRGARPFERAFLLVMLHHEEGALTLASAQLQRGEDPEIRAVAQRLATETARESGRVRRRLQTIATDSR